LPFSTANATKLQYPSNFRTVLGSQVINPCQTDRQTTLQ